MIRLKVDVCAKIPDEQKRKDLCETIEEITGQGWANFDGKVHATYIGEDEAIAWKLVYLFDQLPDHEITFIRGYLT